MFPRNGTRGRVNAHTERRHTRNPLCLLEFDLVLKKKRLFIPWRLQYHWCGPIIAWKLQVKEYSARSLVLRASTEPWPELWWLAGPSTMSSFPTKQLPGYVSQLTPSTWTTWCLLDHWSWPTTPHPYTWVKYMHGSLCVETLKDSSRLRQHDCGCEITHRVKERTPKVPKIFQGFL